MDSYNGSVNVAYLEEASRFFSPIKRQSFLQMQIVKGAHALDVGCGSGSDAIELGRLVSSEGLVFGVDFDQNMLNQAENQVISEGFSDFVKFCQCSANKLPFPNNYFDCSRSERMFIHLTEPQLALAEMYRVTKPEGNVVIVDTDWGSLSIDCQATGTEQLLANYRINKFLNNGYSGRTLYRLFKYSNFSNIDIKIVPLYTNNLDLFYSLSLQEAVENKALQDNIIKRDDLESWRNELKQAAKEGHFFSSLNIVIVSGTIPG